MHILLHHVYAYAHTQKHKHHHTKSTVMPLLCKVQYELGKTSPHKFHGYALVLFRASNRLSTSEVPVAGVGL